MAALEEGEPVPRIKSFIKRVGRMTSGQRVALDTLWEQYCLDPEKSYDFTAVFGNDAPTILEIGFGNGESLAKTALANPDQNYIGIEVHKPGVGSLLLQLDRDNITNVRVFYHDAIEILENCVAEQSLAAVHLFFPDPWHKRKHHKRRIVRDSFMQLLAVKIKSGGYFHTATDWEHYAKHMLKILVVAENFTNQNTEHAYCPRPEYRPLTKFEQRGLRLGHGVWDLIFQRV